MEESEILIRNRKKLYFALLILQIITYVIQLVIGEVYRQHMYYISPLVILLLQIVPAVCINIANVMFLRLFIKRKPVFFTVVTIVILSFFLQTGAASLTSSTNYTTLTLYRVVQITVAILNFIVLCFTFVVGTKDIFSKRHDLTYSLIGAANLFLLIGFVFAMVYIMLQYIFPGIMVPVERTADLPSVCVVYSAYALANMDLPVDLHILVRNIMVMQSICAHLYAVMIVGRLLSK